MNVVAHGNRLQSMVSPLHNRWGHVSVLNELLTKLLTHVCINSHRLCVIVRAHSVRRLWCNVANLPHALHLKGMDVTGHQVTEAYIWMKSGCRSSTQSENQVLLPPQCGAGRPPSFFLCCWKGHRETRVSLRREGNVRVSAHQKNESQVSHTSACVRIPAVLLFRCHRQR